MRKAYKLKVSDAVSNTLDICREFYNAALQERRDAYKLCGIIYLMQAQQLPEIKESRVVERQTFSTESSLLGVLFQHRSKQPPSFKTGRISIHKTAEQFL
ncbi:MAG: hypothetical protein JNN15_03865 [Blastocatellia bacterium]|nr:hypothetical protein [Blastocatellia bacterium]